MKKIAIISEHASPLAALGGVDSGGQNVYVAHVSRQLAERGYEVDVYTRWDSHGRPPVEHYSGCVRVVHVPAGPLRYVRKEELFPYMGDFSRFMIRLMERQGPSYDLVHANFWMSGIVASEIKKAFSIPFAMTFHALGKIRRIHQGKDDGFPLCRSDWEENLAQQADLVIAECPQDKQDLVDFYGADPSKIQIIPCGFDPEEFYPVDKASAKSFIGFGPSENIVLQLGRMVPRKGVDTVIRGFAQMVRYYGINAKLVIVGGDSERVFDSPEIIRLRDLAYSAGIGERVFFRGPVPRHLLKYYYSAADIFVSTPWYEPFGITPLEAMACGTPVIGSRVGGIKYSVEEGATGFLVNPKDASALARKMAQLFERPLLRLSFGKKAITRVHDLFTWRKVADALTEAYSVLERENSHAA